MITSFKFNNCFAFDKPVEMNLRADMRTKKFNSNVFNINENLNILKSIAIYGPNNTGKTTFINCIKAIKGTLENKEIYLIANIFNKEPICEAGMSFIHENIEYMYEFKFNCMEHTYIYEKMSKVIRDKYNNESEDLIYIKDTINDIYECPKDDKLQDVLHFASNNNIIIYTVQTDKFEVLKEVKNILVSIANSIEIVNMNRIPLSKTIEMLKNRNEETEKVVNFIRKADVYLQDIKYIDNDKLKISNKEIEEELKKNKDVLEHIKLVSVYKGIEVPSFIFDSIGTKKIAALASYVIGAIQEGKTLIIDELDSSLHFKVTRAIMSMFNNDINKKAQLIATLHDVSLLDCKKMFRKDQIWFTDKDEEGTTLYSLKEFTYSENGVRDTSDIKEKYSKGEFGAIPEPDLISTLLEVGMSEEI